MTKEFFESNTFEDVIERLNDERDEITTLDRLKEFAKAKIDDGNYFVAKHILEALQSGMGSIGGGMTIVWVLLIRQFQ